MLVGVLVLKLDLPWCHSLKEKRAHLGSLMRRTENKFRVVAAESDYQNLHQTGQITLAFLAPHPTQGDSMMDNVLNYIESHASGEVMVEIREFR